MGASSRWRRCTMGVPSDRCLRVIIIEGCRQKASDIFAHSLPRSFLVLSLFRMTERKVFFGPVVVQSFYLASTQERLQASTEKHNGKRKKWEKKNDGITQGEREKDVQTKSKIKRERESLETWERQKSKCATNEACTTFRKHGKIERKKERKRKKKLKTSERLE